MSTKSFIYLDLHDASEGHAEVAVIIFVENSLEGLLEQRGIEGVSHDYVSPESRAETILIFSLLAACILRTQTNSTECVMQTRNAYCLVKVFTFHSFIQKKKHTLSIFCSVHYLAKQE